MITSEFITTHNLIPEHLRGEVYFDIETLRLSDEVSGGWKSIRDFGIAVVVTWDIDNGFRVWTEPKARELIAAMTKFDRIVSFNGDGFDFEVLSAYGSVDKLRSRSFDVLSDLKGILGHRVKFETVCFHTLGVGKSGDGLKSVEWWRAGNHEKVIDYCVQDVSLLVRVVGHGRRNGHVKIDSGVVPVNWIPAK